jgi:hypothetical protein
LGYLEQKYDELSPRYKLIVVLFPIIIFLIFLIGYNMFFTWQNYYNDTWNNNNKTLLTFDRMITQTSGNLMFLINNNDKYSPKTLNVYGLISKDLPLNLTLSKITNDLKGTYDITFCDKDQSSHTFTINNLNASEPYTTRICIPQIDPGLYQGWLFVQTKNNATSILMTIATEPKVYVAMIWIIIGILNSILVWELLHYFDEMQKASTIAHKLRTARHIQALDPNAREEQVKMGREMIQNDYMVKRFKSSQTPKIVIIDLGTVVLGIAVGFLSLLNQGRWATNGHNISS